MTLPLLSRSTPLFSEPMLKNTSYVPDCPGIGQTAFAKVVCHQPDAKLKSMLPTRVSGSLGAAPVRSTEIRSLPDSLLVARMNSPAWLSAVSSPGRPLYRTSPAGLSATPSPLVSVKRSNSPVELAYDVPPTGLLTPTRSEPSESVSIPSG
jgi:hypothetical protein